MDRNELLERPFSGESPASDHHARRLQALRIALRDAKIANFGANLARRTTTGRRAKGPGSATATDTAAEIFCAASLGLHQGSRGLPGDSPRADQSARDSVSRETLRGEHLWLVGGERGPRVRPSRKRWRGVHDGVKRTSPAGSTHPGGYRVMLVPRCAVEERMRSLRRDGFARQSLFGSGGAYRDSVGPNVDRGGRASRAGSRAAVPEVYRVRQLEFFTPGPG